MDGLSSLYPTNQIGSDGFSWWIGQIESDKKGDFKESGRYRVRIVGYHPQSCDVVDTGLAMGNGNDACDQSTPRWCNFCV